MARDTPPTYFISVIHSERLDAAHYRKIDVKDLVVQSALDCSSAGMEYERTQRQVVVSTIAPPTKGPSDVPMK